jgi:hypothetical protein
VALRRWQGSLGWTARANRRHAFACSGTARRS